MNPLLAPVIMKYLAPTAAGGLLFGLGYVFRIFHAKRIQQKLNEAATKVISTAAQ